MRNPNNMTEPYPVVEVRGTPRCMGRQHGEQAKERVVLMMDHVFGQTTRRMIRMEDGTPPVECDMIMHAESLLPIAERYAPDLVEECRGIAEGAARDFREIFALQYFVDFSSLPLSAPSSGAGACSTLAAMGGAHRDGHVALGWNDDMAAGLAATAIILRAFPDRGPAITGICFAGTIPECGVTRDRAVACNLLPSPRAGTGVPYLFIPRKALQQETLMQSAQVILDAPRIVGMNFMVVDRSGDYVNIETAGGAYRLTDTGDDGYAHTNHFRDPDFAARKEWPPVRWKSQLRQYALERFLRRHRGHIDLDSMKQALSNHAAGLCVHDTSMTVTCMLCDLTSGRAAFSSGPPCHGRFQEFVL